MRGTIKKQNTSIWARSMNTLLLNKKCSLFLTKKSTHNGHTPPSPKPKSQQTNTTINNHKKPPYQWKDPFLCSMKTENHFWGTTWLIMQRLKFMYAWAIVWEKKKSGARERQESVSVFFFFLVSWGKILEHHDFSAIQRWTISGTWTEQWRPWTVDRLVVHKRTICMAVVSSWWIQNISKKQTFEHAQLLNFYKLKK